MIDYMKVYIIILYMYKNGKNIKVVDKIEN